MKKQINSILRTLCLTALLCMTSVNASAYVVYDNRSDPLALAEIIGNILDGINQGKTDRVLVIDQNITTSELTVSYGLAIIIKPGATLTVTSSFSNQSNLYVFGVLDYSNANYPSNYGTIYKVDGGTINGTESMKDNGTITDVSLKDITSKKKFVGQKPEPGKSGWKDYWAIGISQDVDFYPIYTYEDEEYKNEIADLEAWKKGKGSLTLVKVNGQEPTVENDGWKDYYELTEGNGTITYYEDEAFTKPISNLEEWKKNEGKIDKPKSFIIGNTTYLIDENYCYNDDISFTDKDFYQSGNDFTVDGKLEYNRTFKATGVWQAWFVPFDVPVSDMNDAGMEVAEIAGVLMDEKEPYIAFAKMTNTDAIVKANTPYVVKAKESIVSMTLTGPDICIRKSTSAELEAQRLTVQSSFNTFTFGGNYQQTNGYANEWYALNTSGIFQKMGKDVYLAPQRFWMTIDTRTDTPYYTEESGASAKAFIRMTVLGDDEPTGIESLTPTLSEGKGTIYNLQGQKVTSIQKGQVYIMNGKKFFAR